ncbi:VTT domain-containing protein [Candidatus Peregrinibacteria bacterium]|nr:VTT domain-containing protein [Candidatus Peregrinibacteria bacterium]
MKEKQNRKGLATGEIFAILLVIALFIAAAIFAKQYDYLLKEIPYSQGYLGAIFYILITIFAIVVAPISTFPLLPLAISLWGSFFAALYSIIGWTIGAVIAFWLARRYGKPLIGKLMPLEKIQRIEKIIPEKNIFISIVLLRMTLPVDVLSYGLGLFSSICFSLYFFATLIGVIPFAFLFSYAIILPTAFQISLLVLVIIILFSSYKLFRKKQ